MIKKNKKLDENIKGIYLCVSVGTGCFKGTAHSIKLSRPRISTVHPDFFASTSETADWDKNEANVHIQLCSFKISKHTQIINIIFISLFDDFSGLFFFCFFKSLSLFVRAYVEQWILNTFRRSFWFQAILPSWFSFKWPKRMFQHIWK